MSAARRTAIERAVLDDGLTIGAAVRNGALDQIGRLVEALDAEVTRITEIDGPLDTAAALRVARTWRQLVPIMEMHERAPAPPDAPAPTPPTLAQRIAANQRGDTAEPKTNGHAAPAA